MKMKLFILGLPLLILLVILSIITVPWILIYVGNLTEPDPPRPVVTYAEFPFRLEYEINGRKRVIQDTLICEYKGVGTDEGRGKFRKWEQRLASGNEQITLLKVGNNKEIYYPTGGPSYYMDDLAEYETFNQAFPNAAFIEADGRSTTSGIVNADDLLKLYNIKLISWDIAKPITNSFEKK